MIPLMKGLARAKFYITRSMTFLTLMTTAMICLMFFQSYGWLIERMGLPMGIVYVLGTPAIIAGALLFGYLDYLKGTGKHEANLSWEVTPIAMDLVRDAAETRREVAELKKLFYDRYGDDGR